MYDDTYVVIRDKQQKHLHTPSTASIQIPSVFKLTDLLWQRATWSWKHRALNNNFDVASDLLWKKKPKMLAKSCKYMHKTAPKNRAILGKINLCYFTDSLCKGENGLVS